MWKFVIKVILFFLMVGIVDYCFGKTFEYLNAHSEGGDNKRVYDLCEKSKYEILVMGSSRAAHHYVPSIIEDSIGLCCYNAGFEGNGVILSYGILEEIMQRYRPLLIIYDVEPSFDVNEYLADNQCTRYLKYLKPYYRDDKIADIFKNISIDDYYKAHSGIVRYNSSIISILLSVLRDDGESNKGYIPLIGTMAKDRTMEIADESDAKQDTIKLKYLNMFVETVNNSNIPLVVVYSPKFKHTEMKTIKTIERICADNGVYFWNLSNEKMFMDKSLYKEPMHLNDKGAQTYSKFIASKIKHEIMLKKE